MKFRDENYAFGNEYQLLEKALNYLEKTILISILKATPKMVTLISFGSLTWLVANDFESNSTLQQILIAICTSYIFYLMVEIGPKVRAANTLRPVVCEMLYDIHYDCSLRIEQLGTAAGKKADFENVDLAYLERHVGRLFWDQEYINSLPVSFYEMFQVQKNKTRTAIGHLLGYIHIIDPETRRLLLEINRCSFFNSLDFIGNLPEQYNQRIQKQIPLRTQARNIEHYWRLCLNLKRHLEKVGMTIEDESPS